MLVCRLIFVSFIFSFPLLSQELSFSRNFSASRKNIPLEIINEDSASFYLLRYNKEIHDLVVEKRAKPSAEINFIWPLKLDSVNASWFDYERLDHLFFLKNGSVSFLFEKVLNNKLTLYLRTVDSTGRLLGFRVLAELIKDATIRDVDFEYTLTKDKKILLTSSLFYLSGQIKKTVSLINPLAGKPEWQRVLPVEHEGGAFSSSFTCNKNGDLFYFFVRNEFIGFKRKFSSQVQYEIPRFNCRSIQVSAWLTKEDTLVFCNLPLGDLLTLKGLHLLPDGNEIILTVHHTIEDSAGKEKVRFFSGSIDRRLTKFRYFSSEPLNPVIEKSLTYYDGTDDKHAAEKDFILRDHIQTETGIYYFSERQDENYYKEVLAWKVTRANGAVSAQYLFPRKIFFFRERSLFKNIGCVTTVYHNSSIYFFVLENKYNAKQEPGAFTFHRFRKQTSPGNGALTVYVGSPGKALYKKLLFQSSDFEYVPLRSFGNKNDLVLYLNRHKQEKFSILQLNRL